MGGSQTAPEPFSAPRHGLGPSGSCSSGCAPVAAPGICPQADIVMADYRTEAPQILRDFLSYHETIKAHSKRTVDEYFLDLRNFFRYLKQTRDPSLREHSLDEIDIMDVDLDFVASVTLTDIYGYMTYLSRDRVQHQNSRNSGYGLNAASRARKIATIRSFYNYLTNKMHLLRENPVKDVDSPKLKKTLPKYLTLDESIQLLDAVDGKNQERDYCILTLFLNCGLRISELVGLNLNDIQDDALRVLGKGNKVRIIYLNDACQSRSQHTDRIGHHLNQLHAHTGESRRFHISADCIDICTKAGFAKQNIDNHSPHNKDYDRNPDIADNLEIQHVTIGIRNGLQCFLR